MCTTWSALILVRTARDPIQPIAAALKVGPYAAPRVNNLFNQRPPAVPRRPAARQSPVDQDTGSGCAPFNATDVRAEAAWRSGIGCDRATGWTAGRPIE